MIKSGTASTFSYITTKRPFKLEFGLLDPDEILKNSIGSIYNERIYDGTGFTPNFNGVNDP